MARSSAGDSAALISHKIRGQAVAYRRAHPHETGTRNTNIAIDGEGPSVIFILKPWACSGY